METLIKEFAEKIKLYFDVTRMTAFIKLKDRFEKGGFGVTLGSFSHQYCFTGSEITGKEVNNIKERLIKAWLNDYKLYNWVYNLKEKNIFLNGSVFRDDKKIEYNEDTWESDVQTDEEYLSYFYSEDYGTKEEFMLLPTWSEYKKSEEFLNTYGRQFLNETLIFE